jgi:glycine cleavage system aminomethyltransferase T
MSNSSAVQNPVRRRGPLAEKFEAMDVTVGVEQGWDTTLYFTSPKEEAQAVRQSVGLADLSRISKFDLRSRDLDPPPELHADAHIWPQRNGQSLVTCAPESHKVVRGQLDRYAEAARDASPVYVSDVTPVYAALLLAGPQSAALLRKLVDIDLSDQALPHLACTQTGIDHVHGLVARHDLPGIRAYLIFTGREYGEWLWETVLHAGHEFGIQPVGSQACEILGAP